MRIEPLGIVINSYSGTGPGMTRPIGCVAILEHGVRTIDTKHL